MDGELARPGLLVLVAAAAAGPEDAAPDEPLVSLCKLVKWLTMAKCCF